MVDGIFPGEGTGDGSGEGSGPGRHYVLIDYLARWLSGEPVPGDDATEARFFTLDQALAVVDWGETRRVIRAAVGMISCR